jgi:hypothetical protein
MQLKKVEFWVVCVAVEHSAAEAQIEHQSCGRTGTSIGVAQPPIFDGSTSWAVF